MSVKTYLTNNQKEIKQIAKQLIKQNSLTQLEHLIDTEFSRISNKLEKQLSPLVKTTPIAHILNPNKADNNVKKILKHIDDIAKPLYFKAEDTNKGSKCRPYRIPTDFAPKTSWLAEVISTGTPLTGITQKEMDKACAEAKSRLKKAAITYERTAQAETHYKNIIGKINKNNTFDEYVHAVEAEYGKNGINHHTGRKKNFKKTNQVFPRKFLSPLEFSPSILNEELENEVAKYKKTQPNLKDEQNLKYRLPALERTLERVKPIAENDVIENAVYAAIHEHVRNNVKLPPAEDLNKKQTAPAQGTYQPPANQNQQPNTGTTITIDNKVNNNNENKATASVDNTPANPPTTYAQTKKDVQNEQPAQPAKTIDDKVNKEPEQKNTVPETPEYQSTGKTPPVGGVYTVPEHMRETAKETIDDKVDKKAQNETTEPKGGIYTIPDPMRDKNAQNETTEPKGGIYTIIDAMRKALDEAKDKINPEEQDVVKKLYEGLDNAYNMKNKPEAENKKAEPTELAERKPEKSRQGGGILRFLEAVIDSAINPNYKPDIRTDYVFERPTFKEALENIYIDFHNGVVKTLR